MVLRARKIGDAILFNGDCRSILQGRYSLWNSVVSDPPYGISFKSNYRKIKYDKISNDDDLSHLIFACELPATHSKYIFCRWDCLWGNIPKPKSIITWVKNNHSMGDLKHEHGRKTEIILYYRGDNHFSPINVLWTL